MLRYDVVVLDRDLPGVHGDEVCRAVRGERPEIGILMLTAAGGLEDLARGCHWVPTITARIHALARRASPSRPPVLSTTTSNSIPPAES